MNLGLIVLEKILHELMEGNIEAKLEVVDEDYDLASVQEPKFLLVSTLSPKELLQCQVSLVDECLDHISSTTIDGSQGGMVTDSNARGALLAFLRCLHHRVGGD